MSKENFVNCEKVINELKIGQYGLATRGVNEKRLLLAGAFLTDVVIYYCFTNVRTEVP